MEFLGDVDSKTLEYGRSMVYAGLFSALGLKDSHVPTFLKRPVLEVQWMV